MSDLKKSFFMVNKIDFTWELWHEIQKRLSMKIYEQLALDKTDVCDDWHFHQILLISVAASILSIDKVYIYLNGQ